MMKYFSIALFALTSCVLPEDTPEDSFSEPVDTQEDEDTTPSTDPEPDVDPCMPQRDADGMRFDGKVEYANGTIADMSNTRVKMCCSGGCMTAQWSDDGFCFSEGRLTPGTYAFKVMPLGVDNHATPLTFVTVGEEDIQLQAPILVPEFTNRTEVTDGIFDAGNGLEINMVPDAFVSDITPDYIAAVDVNPMTTGLPLSGIQRDKVVGIWYMGSFDTDVFPKWTFQLHDTDYPAGTKLRIVNSSYSDREWVYSGTATVAEDGVVHADLDSGISTLSTLILLEE
jgi:hypothetical protein